MRIILFGIILLLATAPGSVAAISRYVDEDGRTVFVDDESKIPARYLERSESVEGLRELTPEERMQQAERLRRAREEQRFELDEKRRETVEQERLERYRTPVVIEQGRILVPVEVVYDNRTARVNLLLDTGAQRTLLHRHAIEELAIDPDAGEVVYGTGVGGYRIRTQMLSFKTVKVGPFTARDTPVFVLEHRNRNSPHDGLLGMDFLRWLRYQIDYENQIIEWQP